MYKTIKKDDKNKTNISVHRIIPGETLFHRNYGLRICSTLRGASAPSCSGIFPRYFEFYCISHMYDGHGLYYDEKEGEKFIEPGSLICMIPGYIHFYGGWGDNYVEDAVCFYGAVADMLFRSGVFKRGIFSIGKERALVPIIELARDPRDENQLQANIKLQEFICSLYLEQIKGGKREKFELLIKEIKKSLSKWWTVEEMAEFCGMSEVNFRRQFKRKFGISPKQYISHVKITAAAERLSSSNLPVEKIAKEFAYYDQFHFSRRFKAITGLSPSEYRKNMIHRQNI
ncbi:MAG TPA: AraC family transcriptional regulator [Victivallales bacterium]|nr:AraC family transcriptional regulator [Victivallales bacterium]HRR28806.1 AraC family transcriptional regulator [Victivallales bacterium]HRU00923.1 AraC family transcriptional regulator [Victivallales bacterium]